MAEAFEVSAVLYSGSYVDLARPFDLLISLYAGFVSEHCTCHLRNGGLLLVNSSHGDAAMASIDDRYRLVGVVSSRAGALGHAISSDSLVFSSAEVGDATALKSGVTLRAS